MSNKEIAKQIIDAIPEYKMVYVINILEGLKNLITNEEAEPDEWDLQMIEDAKSINDGSTLAFEEMLKRDGLTYADLQDRN